MRILLKLSALNVLILCLVGGFTLRFSTGKFEWGTVGPWAGALLLISFFAYRYRREAFDQFTSKFFDRVDSIRSLSFWVVIWVALSACLAHIARWAHFSATYYDMGFLHQALFHPYEGGKWLMASLSPRESYLVDHFAPALLFLAPIVAPLKSDLWVFVVQSALVFLPVVLVLRFTRFSSPRDRFFVAVCLVCSIALRSAAIWDFREDVLGYVFLLAALAALQKNNRAVYFGAFFAFLLSKEHLWILSLGLALVAWAEYRQKKVAIATAVIALAWGIVLFMKIVPTLQAGLDLMAVNNLVARYREFGSSSEEIVRNILVYPSNWVRVVDRAFLNRESIRYLFLLLVPFAYGIAKRPVFLLAASPAILINLASGVSAQRSLGFHYDIAFLPFLMMALVRAVRSHPISRGKQWFLMVLALVASGRWPGYVLIDHWPNRSDWADVRFLNSISCIDSENLNEQVLAGPIEALAHLTRCKEIRWIRMPKDCVFSRENVENEAALDSSRISGANFLAARRVIVSTADSCAPHLEEWLTTNGFKMHSQADFGRLRMFVSSESLGEAVGKRGGQ